jgi:hypothetical protein
LNILKLLSSDAVNSSFYFYLNLTVLENSELIYTILLNNLHLVLVLILILKLLLCIITHCANYEILAISNILWIKRVVSFLNFIRVNFLSTATHIPELVTTLRQLSSLIVNVYFNQNEIFFAFLFDTTLSKYLYVIFFIYSTLQTFLHEFLL